MAFESYAPVNTWRFGLLAAPQPFNLHMDGQSLSYATLMKDAAAASGLVQKLQDSVWFTYNRIATLYGEPTVAGSVRTVQALPEHAAANWALGPNPAPAGGETYLVRTCQVAVATSTLTVPLDGLRNSSTLTNVRVYIEPPGAHGGMPTLPKIQVWKKAIATGVRTTIGAVKTDPSGDLTAYEQYHVIDRDGLSEVINLVAYQYGVTLYPEEGGFGLVNTMYHCTTVVETPA